jgi:hypothetical protein
VIQEIQEIPGIPGMLSVLLDASTLQPSASAFEALHAR